MNREEALTEWVMPAIRRTWNEKKCDEILKALEQDPVFFPPCQDCNIKMDEIRRAYDKLQKQDPCDAVSRQAAIDLADELKDDLPDDDRLSDMVMSHNEGILEYQTKLSLLPSVLPTQKTGRWKPYIPEYDTEVEYYVCSECGNRCMAETRYCYDCGAKME